MAQHYNHIHPKSSESYGHMKAKGGDHHVSASPGRNATPGPQAPQGMGEAM